MGSWGVEESKRVNLVHTILELIDYRGVDVISKYLLCMECFQLSDDDFLGVDGSFQRQKCFI